MERNDLFGYPAMNELDDLRARHESGHTGWATGRESGAGLGNDPSEITDAASLYNPMADEAHSRTEEVRETHERLHDDLDAGDRTLSFEERFSEAVRYAEEIALPVSEDQAGAEDDLPWTVESPTTSASPSFDPDFPEDVLETQPMGRETFPGHDDSGFDLDLEEVEEGVDEDFELDLEGTHSEEARFDLDVEHAQEFDSALEEARNESPELPVDGTHDEAGSPVHADIHDVPTPVSHHPTPNGSVMNPHSRTLSHDHHNERKETTMASPSFTFDEQSEDAAKIKVVGIGGGGGNAINNMIEKGLTSVEYIALNTDAQALKANKADMKIQIGSTLTHGLGAGARPEIGREAVEENRHEIEDAIEGADMVFITAGMGGGTGTGGAPIVAGIAKKKGILTVGIVTTPFDCEGRIRMKYALEGISELRNSCDTLIVIPNERLLDLADDNTSLKESFAMANEVLYNATRGISDLILVHGLMNVDFADVRTTMINGGAAIMGAATAVGPERAEIAAHEAINSPLLDGLSIRGARNVLVNISAGSSLGMRETTTATNIIRAEAGPEVEVILGTVIDDSYGDELRITVIATGFDFVEDSTQIKIKSNVPGYSAADQRGAEAVSGYSNTLNASNARQFGASGHVGASSERGAISAGLQGAHAMGATGTSGTSSAAGTGRFMNSTSGATAPGVREQGGYRATNAPSEHGHAPMGSSSAGPASHTNPMQMTTPLDLNSDIYYKGEQNLRNLDQPAIQRRPIRYSSAQGYADEDSSSLTPPAREREMPTFKESGFRAPEFNSPVFDEPDHTTSPARPIRATGTENPTRSSAPSGYVERQRIDKSEPEQPAFLRRIMD